MYILAIKLNKLNRTFTFFLNGIYNENSLDNPLDLNKDLNTQLCKYLIHDSSMFVIKKANLTTLHKNTLEHFLN